MEKAAVERKRGEREERRDGERRRERRHLYAV
jgi:hypothetical protein